MFFCSMSLSITLIGSFDGSINPALLLGNSELLLNVAGLSLNAFVLLPTLHNFCSVVYFHGG